MLPHLLVGSFSETNSPSLIFPSANPFTENWERTSSVEQAILLFFLLLHCRLPMMISCIIMFGHVRFLECHSVWRAECLSDVSIRAQVNPGAWKNSRLGCRNRPRVRRLYLAYRYLHRRRFS